MHSRSRQAPLSLPPRVLFIEHVLYRGGGRGAMLLETRRLEERHSGYRSHDHLVGFGRPANVDVGFVKTT